MREGSSSSGGSIEPNRASVGPLAPYVVGVTGARIGTTVAATDVTAQNLRCHGYGGTRQMFFSAMKPIGGGHDDGPPVQRSPALRPPNSGSSCNLSARAASPSPAPLFTVDSARVVLWRPPDGSGQHPDDRRFLLWR